MRPTSAMTSGRSPAAAFSATATRQGGLCAAGAPCGGESGHWVPGWVRPPGRVLFAGVRVCGVPVCGPWVRVCGPWVRVCGGRASRVRGVWGSGVWAMGSGASAVGRADAVTEASLGSAALVLRFGTVEVAAAQTRLRGWCMMLRDNEYRVNPTAAVGCRSPRRWICASRSRVDERRGINGVDGPVRSASRTVPASRPPAPGTNGVDGPFRSAARAPTGACRA